MSTAGARIDAPLATALSIASVALLACIPACGTSPSFGTDASMWLEVRTYRVSQAAHARLFALQSTEPAVVLPRTTAPGDLLPAPPGPPEPPPTTPSGIPLGVTIVDADAAAQLHVLRQGPDASTLAADLDTLDGSDLHRRAVGRLELAPSKGCGLRIEQVVDYVKDYEIEITSSSAVAHPIIAHLRERTDVMCIFTRHDDGAIELEFELADHALQRPTDVWSTSLGAGQPVTIALPRIERIGIGARVALRERDTLVCTWDSPNGERSVVLLRTLAGQLDDGVLVRMGTHREQARDGTP